MGVNRLNCLKCGKNADFDFRSLEVQTLHVRDLKGESRVQALGLFREDGVCRACAERRLSEIEHPLSVLLKRLLPFVLVAVFGVLVIIFLRSVGRAVLMMGLAGILCGAIGIVSVCHDALRLKKEYAALNRDDALARAAWSLTVSLLPKKDGDNDMTYIPLDDRTMKMKNGDLMIEYDLLPAIAKKAWEMIHK